MDFKSKWVLFGTQLSPYALKIAAALTDKKVDFQWVWQLSLCQ